MAVRSNIVRRSARQQSLLGSDRHAEGCSAALSIARARDRSQSPGKFKTELWRSLETGDPLLARTRGASVIAAWHAEFADWRRRSAPLDADLETTSGVTTNSSWKLIGRSARRKHRLTPSGANAVFPNFASI